MLMEIFIKHEFFDGQYTCWQRISCWIIVSYKSSQISSPLPSFLLSFLFLDGIFCLFEDRYLWSQSLVDAELSFHHYWCESSFHHAYNSTHVSVRKKNGEGQWEGRSHMHSEANVCLRLIWLQSQYLSYWASWFHEKWVFHTHAHSMITYICASLRRSM